MTEGIFKSIKTIQFGANPDEIHTFLEEIIKDLNSTDKRLPGALKEAREEMDKYLDKFNTTRKIELSMITDYRETESFCNSQMFEAKRMMNNFYCTYNGEIDSANFNDIAYLNRIAGIVASIESGIEYLENIVANVLKRMEETKSKCEKLGIEYENGNVHINKSLIKTLAKTKVFFCKSWKILRNLITF